MSATAVMYMSKKHSNLSCQPCIITYKPQITLMQGCNTSLNQNPTKLVTCQAAHSCQAFPQLLLFPKTASDLEHDISLCLGEPQQRFGMTTLPTAYVM